MTDELTYKIWIRQIKDMKGGWLGFVVILVTLTCTAAGAWFGLSLFSAGRYPQIVLAIPGLIAGAVGFFSSSAWLWNFRKKLLGNCSILK